jgi:hypothetical protein
MTAVIAGLPSLSMLILRTGDFAKLYFKNADGVVHLAALTVID